LHLNGIRLKLQLQSGWFRGHSGFYVNPIDKEMLDRHFDIENVGANQRGGFS
jgi:hypothetical protein